ncbi:DUF4397 domain-containing protein [Halorientalis halophila]|uniref:DUF4397 domain-containing protein n=1 Tax=Halorientalis halophila TaxID=3108499 RepID=UPI00300B869D
MQATRLRSAASVVLLAVLLGGLVLAGSTAAAAQDGNETNETEELPVTVQNETEEDGTADVRVVHASPDAPPVDVLIDGEAVLENVSFGTVSDYLAVDAGERNVTVTAADDPDTVVYEETLPIQAGAYTVVAAGEVSEDAEEPFRPVLLLDGAAEPDSNESLVRLAHLVPDAPAVDVTVAETNTTLFENVSFGNSSDYEAVPAGDYTLEVRPADAEADADPVATVNVTLDNATAVTAFAVGYLDPEAAPGDEPFDVLLEPDLLSEPTAEANATVTPDIPVAPGGEETPNETTPGT